MEHSNLGCPHGIHCALDEDVLEALRQSEARYRELVEHANAIILRCNTDGIVTYINEYGQQFFGYTEAEIIGKHVVGTIVPATESTGRDLRPLMDDICNNPKKYEKNINENVKKDGERVWVAWTNKVVKDPLGNPIGVFSIGADITEQRALEHRLHQAEKMNAIGHLAGGMAHDFNNMLQGIMSLAELIRRSGMVDARRYAERIIDVSRDAGDLIGQLLAFARKGQYQITQCDLHRIIDEVVLMLSHGGNKKVVIHKNLAAEVATVSGDPSQLKSALLNLGLNAQDAMPDGGTLTFATKNIESDALEQECASRCSGSGRLLQIDVVDTGRGIPEAERARIFDPFFTTKPIGKGAGMGLAAVYGTVTNHKGAIRCDSVIGKGTRFEIILPVDENASIRSVEKAELKHAAMGRLTILVVDDDPVICVAMKDALQARGYLVITFGSGASAVEFYRNTWKDVDVVLIDMIMPGMGGDELYRELKEINPGLVALIATGHVDDGDAQSLLHEGVRGYLKKPFTVERLEECIRECFEVGRVE